MKEVLFLLLFFMMCTYMQGQSKNDMIIVDSIINNQKTWEKKMCNTGIPIEVIYERTTSPNTAGGTGFEVMIRNLSGKAIKYISFTGYPINAVNDRCYCSIRKHSNATLKGVGPIKYGDYKMYEWDNVWYNGDIKNYIPTLITIQYMNGSSVSISGKNIKKSLTSIPSDMNITEALESCKIEAWKIREHLYKNNIRKDLHEILMRCVTYETTLKIECRLRSINSNN